RPAGVVDSHVPLPPPAGRGESISGPGRACAGRESITPPLRVARRDPNNEGEIMSHEIETMTYFGELPWDGLGTALEESDVYDWPAACTKAGLDWGVELVPLVTQDTQATVTHRAVRRSTDGKVLGVVGPRYAPLQNTDAFGWFQPFLEAREAQLHTAG